MILDLVKDSDLTSENNGFIDFGTLFTENCEKHMMDLRSHRRYDTVLIYSNAVEDRFDLSGDLSPRITGRFCKARDFWVKSLFEISILLRFLILIECGTCLFGQNRGFARIIKLSTESKPQFSFDWVRVVNQESVDYGYMNLDLSLQISEDLSRGHKEGCNLLVRSLTEICSVTMVLLMSDWRSSLRNRKSGSYGMIGFLACAKRLLVFILFVVVILFMTTYILIAIRSRIEEDLVVELKVVLTQSKGKKREKYYRDTMPFSWFLFDKFMESIRSMKQIRTVLLSVWFLFKFFEVLYFSSFSIFCFCLLWCPVMVLQKLILLRNNLFLARKSFVLGFDYLNKSVYSFGHVVFLCFHECTRMLLVTILDDCFENHMLNRDSLLVRKWLMNYFVDDLRSLISFVENSPQRDYTFMYTRTYLYMYARYNEDLFREHMVMIFMERCLRMNHQHILFVFIRLVVPWGGHRRIYQQAPENKRTICNPQVLELPQKEDLRFICNLVKILILRLSLWSWSNHGYRLEHDFCMDT